MAEWCDGDAVKVETASDIRNELVNAKLFKSGDADVCISSFMKKLKQLNQIPGQAWSASHVVGAFLKNNEGPSCKEAVVMLNTQSEPMTLAEAS